MRIDNLTEENFYEFAVQSYTNYRCRGQEEFLQDLLHIKYLKRLLRKSNEAGGLNPRRIRLALNHIIIFYNVFKRESATRMLFLRFEPNLHPILKTFLIHLDLMPAIIHGIDGQDLYSRDITIDETILESLKNA
jgi:hypothetical protein